MANQDKPGGQNQERQHGADRQQNKQNRDQKQPKPANGGKKDR